MIENQSARPFVNTILLQERRDGVADRVIGKVGWSILFDQLFGQFLAVEGLAPGLRRVDRQFWEQSIVGAVVQQGLDDALRESRLGCPIDPLLLLLFCGIQKPQQSATSPTSIACLGPQATATEPLGERLGGLVARG
jgi:hypothetical protein